MLIHLVAIVSFTLFINRSIHYSVSAFSTGFQQMLCCCSCQKLNTDSWSLCKGDSVEQASSCAINSVTTKPASESSLTLSPLSSQPSKLSTHSYQSTTTSNQRLATNSIIDDSSTVAKDITSPNHFSGRQNKVYF